jgi:uncharacterized membrane protein
MASSVVAILFPSATDAERLKTRLEELQDHVLLKIREAAVIVRDQDGNVSYHTSTHQPGAGEGAAFGGLLGMLLGSIFLTPVGGLAIGAATGALAGHLRKIEVDAEFKHALNDGLRPNSSVLVLRVDQVQSAEVREQLARFLTVEQIHGQVLYSNLSPEAEEALAAALQS